MKILIDTNIILDVLMKREPHFDSSEKLLKLCGTQLIGCIVVSQTTDIFYLISRNVKDAQFIKDIIKKLTDNLKVLDINSDDVKCALESDMDDYEDALLAFCAKRQKVEYIITRNEKDFKLSPVKSLSPQEFIEQIFN